MDLWKPFRNATNAHAPQAAILFDKFHVMRHLGDALGPRAGHKVLSLQTLPSRPTQSTQALCANAHGFSLHAAVRCRAHQRKQLERLCRYITRPAMANERLKCNRAGPVVLQLKSPYRDATTHIVMSPLEFLQRLAAREPRPRLHRIRFHGVLAPDAKLRAQIVPSEPVNAHEACDHHAQAAPALSAGAHELGVLAQTGIRYRHRTVPALWARSSCARASAQMRLEIGELGS